MSLPQPLPRVLATEEILPTMKRVINEYNTVRARILQSTTAATFCTVMRPQAEV